jgi:Cdc6-like AAA superfamily ATPase
MDFFKKIKEPQDLERCICYPPGSHSEVELEVIKSLPIHFKLILYACLMLHNQKKKNERVKLCDVFFEYQKLTTELNFTCMSLNQVADKIREFDMLGLLKNKYVRKGSGQIKYIDINPNSQSQFLIHISVLREEINNIKPSELETEELIKKYLDA